MKLKPRKANARISDARNPFLLLKPLVTPQPNPQYDTPMTLPNPEARQAARKQDKPTAADAAFEAKYGFKRGMDEAKKSDAVRGKYLQSQQRQGYNPNEWTPDDVWTARKDPRVAGATKQPRVGPADAMASKRAKGLRPIYNAPDQQRLLEEIRRRALVEQRSFEKGLELARSK